MRLSQLQFCSLLSYCPRGNSDEAKRSKNVMLALKSDKYIDNPPILMSKWIAKTLQQNISSLPCATYFQQDTSLVPTPKSSLMRPNTLWVPERIASAIVKNGLGKEVLAYSSHTSILVLVFTSLLFLYVSFQFHEINKKRE